MSEMPVPSWGGPETETQLQFTRSPGEVDYTLIEKILKEGTFDAKVPYLALLIHSGDREAISIGVDAIPAILAEGITREDIEPATLDMIRNLWKEAMTSEDEDVAYEAQELYTMVAGHLEKRDITTFGWLKDSVCVEWFD